MTNLSDRELEDIAYAMNIAVRQINIFSATASRFMALERRAREELRRREAVTPPG
jgi:hypothetical protein